MITMYLELVNLIGILQVAIIEFGRKTNRSKDHKDKILETVYSCQNPLFKLYSQYRKKKKTLYN